MKAARRFVNDEAGMTMALAVIMIAVLGVMGAGLLTFVSRDLNTVVEENRGQRAFEVADAGVGVAKRQLISDCVNNLACSAHYNGDGPPTEDNVCGADDIQWSALRCDNPDGLTLENLDGDDGTTDDHALVKIKYRSDTDDFKVVSTGFYGNAKRKIEAIFEGTSGGAGGGNIINPAYYAPSNVLLKEDVTLAGISLFSEKNIIIQGLRPYSQCIPEPSNPNSGTYPRDCLYAEYEKTGDVLTTTSNPGRAELGDWDSRKFFDNDVPDLTYNTTGRVKRGGGSREEKGPGFAAEGLICGSTTSCSAPSDSIAEGRYGYDSTTGTKGQHLRFAKKINCSTGIEEPERNPNGTTCSTPAQDIITYPFERKAPDAATLKQRALNTGSWYRGPNPNWAQLLGSGRRVAFIDAENQTLTLDQSSGAAKGIIVVWCGSLNVNNLGSSGFKGLIMTLNGSSVEEGLPLDPSGAESTSCDANQGSISSIGTTLNAWLYAEREDDPLTPAIEPSIVLGRGTKAAFIPSGQYRLLNKVLQDPLPTDFTTEGWRECYRSSPATECGT